MGRGLHSSNYHRYTRDLWNYLRKKSQKLKAEVKGLGEEFWNVVSSISNPEMFENSKEKQWVDPLASWEEEQEEEAGKGLKNTAMKTTAAHPTDKSNYISSGTVTQTVETTHNTEFSTTDGETEARSTNRADSISSRTTMQTVETTNNINFSSNDSTVPSGITELKTTTIRTPVTPATLNQISTAETGSGESLEHSTRRV